MGDLRFWGRGICFVRAETALAGAFPSAKAHTPNSTLDIPPHTFSRMLPEKSPACLPVSADTRNSGPAGAHRSAAVLFPLLGDHGSRRDRFVRGTYIVADLGSHWARVRADFCQRSSDFLCGLSSIPRDCSDSRPKTSNSKL